jgi:hypothetical protein
MDAIIRDRCNSQVNASMAVLLRGNTRTGFLPWLYLAIVHDRRLCETSVLHGGITSADIRTPIHGLTFCESP